MVLEVSGAIAFPTLELRVGTIDLVMERWDERWDTLSVSSLLPLSPSSTSSERQGTCTSSSPTNWHLIAC